MPPAGICSPPITWSGRAWWVWWRGSSCGRPQGFRWPVPRFPTPPTRNRFRSRPEPPELRLAADAALVCDRASPHAAGTAGKERRAQMLPLESGDPATIGPYRLLGVLGAGGMGRVYLGRNAGGRTVAVKVVRPDLSDDPEFRTRFRREVAAARRVTGAHAVP